MILIMSHRAETEDEKDLDIRYVCHGHDIDKCTDELNTLIKKQGYFTTRQLMDIFTPNKNGSWIYMKDVETGVTWAECEIPVIDFSAKKEEEA